MAEEHTALVIDTGSESCRVGFAGEDSPQSIVPSLVGRHGWHDRDSYIGEDAQLHREICTMIHPLEDGLISNWEEMQRIWVYIFFNKVCEWPADHPTLVTELPLTPKTHREQLTQIMFESYSTPGLYIAPQSVLSLYACGRTTGVVADIGHKVSNFAPVIEGNLESHATEVVPLGGDHLTNYMASLLNTTEMSLEYTIAKSIKEKFAYVSADPHLSESPAAPIVYKLPDGKEITLGNELPACPEGLFKPSLMNDSSYGIHETLESAILQCGEGVHAELYSNVVLAGGSSLFSGLSERLKRELIALNTFAMPTIIAPPERQYSAWVGGSILASLSSFQTSWMSIEEYNESGPSICRRNLV